LHTSIYFKNINMSMAQNGISTLSTKQQRQEAKLAAAAAKRAGETPARRSTLDINKLPTKYSGNDVVDNPNPSGLLPGRPWS
jgi:hypothetical protein